MRQAGASGGDDPLEIEAPRRLVENSDRPVILRRPRRAIEAYREMLSWYAARTVLERLSPAAPAGGAERPADLLGALAALDSSPAARARTRYAEWENIGGQLVPAAKLEALLDSVRAGRIADWRAMHAEYARLSAEYPADKAAHAWAILRLLSPDGGSAPELLDAALGELLGLSRRIEDEVASSRAKDFSNPFRRATFRSEAEMIAVVGRPEESPFVVKTRRDMEALREGIGRMRAALSGL
jgi:hypothetical protein